MHGSGSKGGGGSDARVRLDRKGGLMHGSGSKGGGGVLGTGQARKGGGVLCTGQARKRGVLGTG